jgi:hypothetical protein
LPLHLLEGGGHLITIEKSLELLEFTDEILAAELDLLSRSSGTGGIGIDRHARANSGGQA